MQIWYEKINFLNRNVYFWYANNLLCNEESLSECELEYSVLADYETGSK